MVPRSRMVSCSTMLIWARSESTVKVRMSWPSTRTAPDCGSYSRGSSWAIVLFPAPLCPTSATTSPAARVKLTDWRVRRAGSPSGSSGPWGW